MPILFNISQSFDNIFDRYEQPRLTNKVTI